MLTYMQIPEKETNFSSIFINNIPFKEYISPKINTKQ